MNNESISAPLRQLVKTHFESCYQNIKELSDVDFQWGATGEPSSFEFGAYGKIFFSLSDDERQGFCLFRLMGSGAVATDGVSEFWNVAGATSFEEKQFEGIRFKLEEKGIFVSENDSYFSKG